MRLTIDTTTDPVADVVAALGQMYGVALTINPPARAPRKAAKASAPRKAARTASKKPAVPAAKAPARKAQAGSTSRRRASAKDVRAWAASRSLTVSPRGRIPVAVLEQYAAANG